MKIDIQTTANNGQMVLFVINNNGATILTLNGNTKGSCLLVPGFKYRLEWHTWSPEAADYTISATVTPNNSGFPPFNLTKSYQGPSSDMGGFFFTLN